MKYFQFLFWIIFITAFWNCKINSCKLSMMNPKKKIRIEPFENKFFKKTQNNLNELPSEILIKIIQYFAKTDEDLFKATTLNKEIRKTILNSKIVCDYIFFYPKLFYLENNFLSNPIFDSKSVHPFAKNLIINESCFFEELIEEKVNEFEIISQNKLLQIKKEQSNFFVYPRSIFFVENTVIDLNENEKFGFNFSKLSHVRFINLNEETNCNIVFDKEQIKSIKEIEFIDASYNLILEKLKLFNPNKIENLVLERIYTFPYNILLNDLGKEINKMTNLKNLYFCLEDSCVENRNEYFCEIDKTNSFLMNIKVPKLERILLDLDVNDLKNELSFRIMFSYLEKLLNYKQLFITFKKVPYSSSGYNLEMNILRMNDKEKSDFKNLASIILINCNKRSLEKLFNIDIEFNKKYDLNFEH